MKILKNQRRRLFTALLAMTLAPGCASFGPNRIVPDNFNYNEAISQSSKEQMLANLIRLRHQDVPVFLTVNSVLTQYIFSGNARLTGSVGTAVGENANSVTGSIGAIYIERPTITYSPLTGSDFSRQLLKRIDSQLLFSLFQSGFPPKQLLLMSLERINHVENLPFNRLPMPSNAERYESFRRVVDLMIELAKRRAIEMQTMTGPNGVSKRILVIDQNPDLETQRILDEWKTVLKLDRSRFVFNVTDRAVNRGSDELTIRVRSLLTLMSFLAQGIESAPPSKPRTADSGRSGSRTKTETAHLGYPVRVQTSAERPADAFVTTRYRNRWYYIADTDDSSKQAFSLLTYLFLLQAPEASKSAPILTVPTG